MLSPSSTKDTNTTTTDMTLKSYDSSNSQNRKISSGVTLTTEIQLTTPSKTDSDSNNT